MELPRIGNEAIKKELNCNCSCRAHDIYVRMLSKESTHDRALSVGGDDCLAPTGAECRGGADDGL